MATLIENSVNSGDISIETILSEALLFVEKYMIHPEGFVISLKGKTPRILQESKCGYKSKYSFVTLRIGGRNKQEYIHRLVAKYFIPNPDNKQQVNHIDGDTNNNCVSNLEWVTPAENSQHAHDTGLAPSGVYCPWSKASEEQVVRCYTLHLNGISNREIQKETGLTSSQVWKINTKKQWRSVTDKIERATTIPYGSTLQANGSGSAEQL